ncbi:MULTISPECIES: hypothetical protein [unclassified Nocardioides]|uniref:hypothetical protein n=1 Tax=unclassified Nocardioides TaxID=2615069 RepID=UPI000056FFE9|nr:MULTISPECIES: hypothetical protein [unclassified Nocardioides]ABL81227.1 conserved hypothetical protein [Nocardioides sp. JS614]
MTVRRPAKPAPLVVAASLVAIEALFLLGYAVLELFSVSSGRVAVAVTTSAFFAAYGAVLLFCAREVTRGRSWARSPIVLAQLIQLGVAWSFRGGDTTPVAVALAVVAVVVLAGLLAPSSVDALADDRIEDRD